MQGFFFGVILGRWWDALRKEQAHGLQRCNRISWLFVIGSVLFDALV